jgi:hypothetical protein
MATRGKLCFLDDAGDVGFKLDRGSSAYFIIACVAFDETIAAEEVALNMKKLRRDLGWNEFQEFKFNKTRKEVIKNLLSRVADYDFSIHV